MWQHIETFTGVKIAKVRGDRNSGLTALVDGPDNLITMLNSVFLDDEQFTGAPDLPGFYTCNVEVWFSQGYNEGYKDDRDNEVEYRLVNVELVA